MSTSPRRSPVAGEDGRRMSAPSPKSFPYDSLPPRITVSGIARDAPATASVDSREGVSPDETVAWDGAAREAEARVQGRREGLAEARKALEEQLEHERTSLAAALAQFTRDRAVYFQKIEGEVVQLALSIARKILYREAQIDPLLLAGIVRVALEKIDGATGVVLRIHPQNAADWRRYLATHLEPSDVPEIVEDSSQPPDGCTLETSMGTATMGLEVQLKEIEQGLMDLLAARPGAAS
jgi:flagellar biosynthesis/type III secretory pathway protein FliH